MKAMNIAHVSPCVLERNKGLSDCSFRRNVNNSMSDFGLFRRNVNNSMSDIGLFRYISGNLVESSNGLYSHVFMFFMFSCMKNNSEEGLHMSTCKPW